MRWFRTVAGVLLVGTAGLLAERLAIDPQAEAEQIVRWVTVEGSNRSAYFASRVMGGQLAYVGGARVAQAKKVHGRWRIQNKSAGLCRGKAFGQEGIGMLDATAKKCTFGSATAHGAGSYTSEAGFQVLMKNKRLRWVKYRPEKGFPRERILGPMVNNARHPLCQGLEFHGFWRPKPDSPRLRVESRAPGFYKNGKCWFVSGEKNYMKSSSEFWYLRRFDGPLKG